MKTTYHTARLSFLSRLMLAWHLRHHWHLKQAFPRCYWTVRWAWHCLKTAVCGCRTELMPALYLARALPVRVCRCWRVLVAFVARHTPRRHSHTVSRRVG
ncbi:hypothetical protein FD644_22895 [Serratia fonticola]|uniref:hypothetical protein n=1 Tax=Serratia fonticola TaxID=47917 RepID=UPI0010CCF221|nr:hypothetical protein [Serratia fonticola]QCR63017.1 hypothetical protein FD644_22895 [Serratia fonticola]